MLVSVINDEYQIEKKKEEDIKIPKILFSFLCETESDFEKILKYGSNGTRISFKGNDYILIQGKDNKRKLVYINE